MGGKKKAVQNLQLCMCMCLVTSCTVVLKGVVYKWVHAPEVEEELEESIIFF